VAHIHRLIGLLLVAFAGQVYASFPATPGACQSNCYEYQVANQSGVYVRDPVVACAPTLNNYPTLVWHSFSPPTTCVLRDPNNGGTLGVSIVRRSAPPDPPTCPSNATLSGNTCTCNSGYAEQGNACVIPPDPGEEHCQSINGSPVKASWITTNPSLSTRTICMSNAGYNCTATVTGDICGGTGSGGSYVCHGSGVSGGSGGGTTCTPSPEPDAPPPSGTPDTNWPEAPPPGMCPGTVNGVSVTVPCSSTSTQGTTSSESNDGEGNTTQKTETKATTCNAAGSCTTTTTTTTTVNGGTPKTTTSSTTQGKGEFCAANRGSKECGDGDGSSFGGNCEASFVCTGDAVQCALTKEVHIQHCKLNKETDESLLYAQSKDAEPDLGDEETVNVGPGDFSTAPVLGAGACITNRSVTVMGATLEIPFSDLCQYLAMLGNVLMAVAWLLSARIVMRG